MALFSSKQLNFFKLLTVVLDEFPVALRLVFVYMWDNFVSHVRGYPKWDDSQAVRDMFLNKEGGKTKVPTNKSFMEWDCTTCFEATLFSETFAVPDASGKRRPLKQVYVKRLSPGAFHTNVQIGSPFRSQSETYAIALDQLRLIRNSLCHRSSTRTIDQATFNRYIGLIIDAFAALGQDSTRVEVIANLEDDDFPTAKQQKLEEDLVRERIAAIKFKQMGDHLEEIKSGLKTVNTEVTDVKTKVENVGAGVEKILRLLTSECHQDMKIQVHVTPPCTFDNIAANVHNQGCSHYNTGDKQSALGAFQAAGSMRSYMLGENINTARSFNNLGVVQRDMGDLKGAVESVEKALRMSEKLLGNYHETAAYSNNLGCFYLEMSDTSALAPYQQGSDTCSNLDTDFENKIQLKMENLNRASGYLQRATDMYSRLDRERLGPQTDTAAAFHNLGCVNFKMGKPEAAVMAFQKATEIRSSLLGDNEYTACSYHWLGVAQLRTGDLRGALDSLKEASRLYKKHFKDHHDTATSLRYLGRVYFEMGDTESALNVIQEAVDINSNLPFGQEQTACSYHCLGVVQRVKGDFGKALESLQKASQLYKQHSQYHPDTATIIHELACLYLEMGDKASAVEAFQEAAHTRSRLLGDHELTAISYHRLGVVQREVGDLQRALESLQKAADMKDKLQLNRKDTACSYHWLGVVQHDTGNQAGALEALKRASQLREELLRDHPDTAASYYFLGRVHVEMNNDNLAAEAFQKAAGMRSKLLGDDKDTAESYHSLGEVQLRLGDLSNASYSLEKTSQLNKKLAGDHSASYLLSQHDLGCVYYKMGYYGLAVEAFTEAADKRAKVLGDKPETACSYFNLGLAQRKNRDLKGAVKSLKRASHLHWMLLRNHRTTALAFDVLGCVYLEVGETREADKAFHEVKYIRSLLDSDYVDTMCCFLPVAW